MPFPFRAAAALSLLAASAPTDAALFPVAAQRASGVVTAPGAP